MLRDTAVQKTGSLDEKTVKKVAKKVAKKPRKKATPSKNSKVTVVIPNAELLTFARKIARSGQICIALDENTIMLCNNPDQAMVYIQKRRNA
jgi:hypothetical protein